MFEQYRNLYADLSAGSALGALKRDLRVATELLTRFSDRILFGRDCYGGALQSFLKALQLSDEVRERICHGNAQRLLAK